MNQFKEWIYKEAHNSDIVKLILKFVLLDLFISVTAGLILDSIGHGLSSAEGTIPIFTFSFPFILITVALVEEIIFRFPLSFIVDSGASIGIILIMAAISSVIFGLLHGGVPNIFVQGIGGFLYCLLFLKAGGLQGKSFKALMVTTLTHFTFNVCVIVMAIFEGVTHI